MDGLLQERCNSSALALELCLSCTNPSLWWTASCLNSVNKRMSWLVNAFHIIGLLWGESTDHRMWVIWEAMMLMWHYFNTLRLRRNGRHFADGIFKYIFLNENVWIPIKISIKFVPKGPINNIPALVQIMAWRRPGNKPLSEPMMVGLTTHICVTQPQWVNKPQLMCHEAS